jgi:hypothetical protein
MSKSLLFSALAIFSMAALAQEPDQSTQPAPDTEQMQQMQTRMQAMREQMARIHATEDPEERQRLMQEHMQSMHQGMMTMDGMTRGPMAEGQTGQCQRNDAECRMDEMQMQQQMMGQRMGMMQQMMEHMMQHMVQGDATGTPEGTPEDESHEGHH